MAFEYKRKVYIRTGFGDKCDARWGRFKPNQRLNEDQSPLPFVIEKKRTYEEKPELGQSRSHTVWILQPGAGLEKRQCSLQLCFSCEGPKPKPAIVFRGKGCISNDEREAYHQGIDVYFQANAWVDTAVAVDWANCTLRKSTE